MGTRIRRNMSRILILRKGPRISRAFFMTKLSEKNVNLSNVEIIRAHGQSIIDLLDEAKLLAEKYQNSNDIKNDKRLIEILTKDPISLYSPDETKFEEIHEILSSYENDARKYYEISLDDSLNPVGIEDQIVKFCYKLEILQRGERPGGNITMGVHPIAIRVTALMHEDLTKRNEEGWSLNPDWLRQPLKLERQKEKSQLLFNKIIHDLPGYTMNTYAAKKSNGETTSRIGIFNKYNEFKFHLTIELSDEIQKSPNNIVITDEGIVIPKAPDAYLASKIGEPVESIIDYDFLKGMDLTVENYHQLDDFSHIKFNKTSLEGIVIENAPEDWFLKI